MSKSLVGTSFSADDTVRLAPGDASHLVDEVTGDALDRYCCGLAAALYPRAVLRWDTARLDDGVVVIHVFDAGAGVHYRTMQPWGDRADVWECLNPLEGDSTIARAVGLLGLVAMGNAALAKLLGGTGLLMRQAHIVTH